MLKKLAICILSSLPAVALAKVGVLFVVGAAVATVGFPEPARMGAPLQPHPTPLTTSGLIQNVQVYSPGPFHTVGGPYNQRFPVPVFAQGTELNAGDCQHVLAALVASECARRNNCVGLRVSDIRPAIMHQLSLIPGHNFVSACSGFLDGAFATYQQSAQLATGGGFPSAFPMPGSGGAGVAGGAATGLSRELVLNNPLEDRLPPWRVDQLDRRRELMALQAQQAPDHRLQPTAAPRTFDDLSFAERQEILHQGYQPWQDARAYDTNFSIETEVEMRGRLLAEARHEADLAEQRRRLQDFENPDRRCEQELEAEIARAGRLPAPNTITINEINERCPSTMSCRARLTCVRGLIMEKERGGTGGGAAGGNQGGGSPGFSIIGVPQESLPQL